MLFVAAVAVVAVLIMMIMRLLVSGRRRDDDITALDSVLDSMKDGAEAPDSAIDNTESAVGSAVDTIDYTEPVGEAPSDDFDDADLDEIAALIENLPEAEPEIRKEDVVEDALLEETPEAISGVRVVTVDDRAMGSEASTEDSAPVREPVELGDVFSENLRNEASSSVKNILDTLTLGDLGVGGADSSEGDSDKIDNIISKINTIDSEADKPEEVDNSKTEDASSDDGSLEAPSGQTPDIKPGDADTLRSSEKPEVSVRYRAPAQYGIKNMAVDKNGRVHSLAELRNQIR